MLDIEEIRSKNASARECLRHCAAMTVALEWALVTVAQLADELERTRETLVAEPIAMGRSLDYVGRD
jgi:predicted transcriptional regulator